MTGEVNSELFAAMKQDLERGLDQFGRYSFWDKGPSEVCRIPYRKLRALSPQDAAATLQAFSKLSDEAQRYVQTAVVGLDDWDELFDESAPWHGFICDHY